MMDAIVARRRGAHRQGGATVRGTVGSTDARVGSRGEVANIGQLRLLVDECGTLSRTSLILLKRGISSSRVSSP